MQYNKTETYYICIGSWFWSWLDNNEQIIGLLQWNVCICIIEDATDLFVSGKGLENMASKISLSGAIKSKTLASKQVPKNKCYLSKRCV